MPVAINNSSLPPKASAGSEASQQIGIPHCVELGVLAITPHLKALLSLLLPLHLLHFFLKTFWVQLPRRLLLLWGISQYIPWALLPHIHLDGSTEPGLPFSKPRRRDKNMWDFPDCPVVMTLSSQYRVWVRVASLVGEDVWCSQKKKACGPDFFFFLFLFHILQGLKSWVDFLKRKVKHCLLAGVAPTALLSPPRDPKSCHSVLPWGTGAFFFALWSEYYAFALTGLVFYIGATDLFGTKTY